MKKTLTVLLLAAVLLTLTGASEKKTPENILYEKGLELTAKMDMLAENEDYINLMTPDTKVKEILKQISDVDYHEPGMVFEISGLDKAAKLFLAQNGAEFPEEIKKIMEEKFIASFSTQITAQEGMDMLTAASIIPASDSFICEGIEESKWYLYLYGKEYASLVSFIPNDENIILASSSVLRSEKLKNISSGEDVKQFITETTTITDITVTQISTDR